MKRVIWSLIVFVQFSVYFVLISPTLNAERCFRGIYSITDQSNITQEVYLKRVEACLNFQKRDYRYRALAASIAYGIGDNESSIAYAKLMLEIEPKSFEAERLMALNAEALENNELAFEFRKRIWEQDKYRLENNYLLILLLIEKRDFNFANKILNIMNLIASDSEFTKKAIQSLELAQKT